MLPHSRFLYSWVFSCSTFGSVFHYTIVNTQESLILMWYATVIIMPTSIIQVDLNFGNVGFKWCEILLRHVQMFGVSKERNYRVKRAWRLVDRAMHKLRVSNPLGKLCCGEGDGRCFVLHIFGSLTVDWVHPLLILKKYQRNDQHNLKNTEPNSETQNNISTDWYHKIYSFKWKYVTNMFCKLNSNTYNRDSGTDYGGRIVGERLNNDIFGWIRVCSYSVWLDSVDFDICSLFSSMIECLI